MNRRRKWSILPSSSTSLVVVIVMRMDRIIWPFSMHSFNRKLFVEIYQALKWMGKYDGGTKDTEREKERSGVRNVEIPGKILQTHAPIHRYIAGSSIPAQKLFEIFLVATFIDFYRTIIKNLNCYGTPLDIEFLQIFHVFVSQL